MPSGPQKLILIQSGRYDYAEVELGGSLQIVGPNNTGKTTLINTLQFLYLDDRRQMDFGSYTPEQTRDYYFANQYSYILFQCAGVRGQSVLGWRGQSKASGAEPERFTYEGSYDPADFLEESGQVREPKAINARLSLKHYTVLKNAQDHRERLLLPTKGEGRGLGLVALRDNDKYPQFRETLKNLLCLSTITQEQMRDRLLMLAGLPTDRHALDVRELFGDDYDRITQLKAKLILFKKSQPEVLTLVQTSTRRDALRGEQMHCWTDLREKRRAFEQEHETNLANIRTQAEAATARARTIDENLVTQRAEEKRLSETKGGLHLQLTQLAAQSTAFADFIEDFTLTALANLETDIRKLEQQLSDAAGEPRDKAQTRIDLYRSLVAEKKRSIAHFDRALVTVLRRDLSEAELAPLSRLFNFELLSQPVGDDGVRIIRHQEFLAALRLLSQRIHGETYRDDMVEFPLPALRNPLSGLANVESLRERLVEDEQTLLRSEATLQAIIERETLTATLAAQKKEAEALRTRLLEWSQFKERKAGEPALKKEAKDVETSLAAIERQIIALELEARTERDNQETAKTRKVEEENRFNQVMSRYALCDFPEFPATPKAPADSLPDDFDASIALFLRAQTQLTTIDKKLEDLLRSLEGTLGSSFTGANEAETIRLLREELEALPDREEVLSRDWVHHLTHMQGVFDEVLKGLGDIRSAAEGLTRSLSTFQVSNLQALRMDAIELADVVGSIRKLARVEQPGLFDDSTSLEATLGAFRQKFEASPLLRYTDLFTLRFTVTGDDGKPHHYDNFRQVESHGTTITIKVLFNLLVLRRLLREDARKSLLCEVPFFLDEIHSLDPINRHAILATARQLGFIAITAAPASISEVDALYFLQAKAGRIVLRNRHRIGVKTQAKAKNEPQATGPA